MNYFAIRKYDPVRDYNDLCTWWMARGWGKVDPEFLPHTGVVVEKDGVKVAAGFLYLSSTRIAWLEWVVTNPAGPLRARPDALGALVDSLLAMAKTAGCRAVFSSLKNENLEKIYCAHGFAVTDRGVTHLLANLGD